MSTPPAVSRAPEFAARRSSEGTGTGYAGRRDALAHSLRGTRDDGPLRLDKGTSNLFRDRDSAPRRQTILDSLAFLAAYLVMGAVLWLRG